jgi:hypothetical protein
VASQPYRHIDYTNLNKECPKDPYPLTGIDQIVDSTSSCEFLPFLDAYSRFNQIQMAREHEGKMLLSLLMGFIAFFLWLKGWKNALSTFVGAPHKTFGDLIRGIIEVYGNDIIVQTRQETTFL